MTKFHNMSFRTMGRRSGHRRYCPCH